MSNVIAFPSSVAAVVPFPKRARPRPAADVSLPRDPAQGLLRTWIARIKHRRDLRLLAMHQPDSVLEDVGLIRDQVEHEALKPFWRA